MKKHLFYSLLGAAFLFAACEQPMLDVNPNFDPETNSVKTQFVLNISNDNGPATKQSADIVQAGSSVFRGIDTAYLLTIANAGKDGQIFAPDMTMDKIYDISGVAGANEITSTSSRRVMEMSLPLKTNQMLFYGKATKTRPSPFPSGITDDDYFGKAAGFKTITNEEGSVRIQLMERLTNEAGYTAAGKYLATCFTYIMNTSVDLSTVKLQSTGYPSGLAATETDPVAGNPYKFDINQGTTPEFTGVLKWSDYADASNNSPVNNSHSLFAMEEKLDSLYVQMTTVRSAGGELRAGSGEATLKIITDLWGVINNIRCANPMNKEETIAKYFAELVHLRISKLFNGVTLNKDGSIQGQAAFIAISNGTDAASINTLFSSLPNSPTEAEINTHLIGFDFSIFPTQFNLPRGASHTATMNATDGSVYFCYPSVFNTQGMGTAISGDDDNPAQFNELSYYYPAELLYFGNSPIRASDQALTENQFPNGAGNGTGKWENDASWNGLGFTQESVQASTHSVAMKYDINYGVAVLETKVRVSSASGILKDNNHAIQVENHPGVTFATGEEPDKEFNVSDANFVLTGIIIGGQSKYVGWDFLPLKTATRTTAGGQTVSDYEEGFIYDKYVNPGAEVVDKVGTEAASLRADYTLVFDNFLHSGETGGFYTPDTQLPVHVALEFKNNMGDFFGNHNLIKNGGYFYLIGVLNPNITSDNTPTAPVWHTDGYVTPPYKLDDNNKVVSNQVNRVFIQDFMTKVVFTIGENSLKSAYLTVPDLRSSSLKLGLSVDMKWESGMNFGEVVLGQ